MKKICSRLKRLRPKRLKIQRHGHMLLKVEIVKTKQKTNEKTVYCTDHSMNQKIIFANKNILYEFDLSENIILSGLKMK